jgi:hypothetical protein
VKLNDLLPLSIRGRLVSQPVADSNADSGALSKPMTITFEAML